MLYNFVLTFFLLIFWENNSLTIITMFHNTTLLLYFEGKHTRILIWIILFSCSSTITIIFVCPLLKLFSNESFWFFDLPFDTIHHPHFIPFDKTLEKSMNEEKSTSIIDSCHLNCCTVIIILKWKWIERTKERKERRLEFFIFKYNQLILESLNQNENGIMNVKKVNGVKVSPKADD
jgi:hypothetical protein